MNRIYEELFILRPDITEEEIGPIVDQLRTVVTTAGGSIDKEERWGVRRLAYRIDKRAEGYYVLLQFSAAATAVRELERRLRVNDAVLKFLTVRIDEKLKWLQKRKEAREKRAARKPQVFTPAPPAGDEARPAMPAAPGAPAAPAVPVPGVPSGSDQAPPAASPETQGQDQE